MWSTCHTPVSVNKCQTFTCSLTFVTSVSGCKTSFLAALSHCSSSGGPRGVRRPRRMAQMRCCRQIPEVKGKERIPRVSVVWATTHNSSRHGAFSNDCYWCKTSGVGEKLNWSWSGVQLKTIRKMTDSLI